MDTDHQKPPPKEAWMPSVAEGELKASERPLPAPRSKWMLMFVIYWLASPAYLRSASLLLVWGFLGLALLSIGYFCLRLGWPRQQPGVHPTALKMKKLNFKLNMGFLGFVLVVATALFSLDVHQTNPNWSYLRFWMVLTLLLCAGLIVLINQRRTQGP